MCLIRKCINPGWRVSDLDINETSQIPDCVVLQLFCEWLWREGDGRQPTAEQKSGAKNETKTSGDY